MNKITLKGEHTMDGQIIHVTINPQGEIIGPIGTFEFVKEALIIGYRRITENYLSEDDAWKIIESAGYEIRKALIIL